jgi:TnpA family transposase
VLPIEEHTTDTHGYTQIIFGAYDLIGLRFAPRIRDLYRQRFYQHGTPPTVEAAELVKHKLRSELITPHWHELLRLAASLHHGWAPASLLLARLEAGSRRDPLARALQEYGRLMKTNFVLAWLEDQQLRSRIGRQLNKGDQLHALRRFLFCANEGHVQHRTPEQQAEQALRLTIVRNAIIVWNTVYTQRVIDHLRAEGQLITTSEIERISPLPHQHIHAYGRYPFNLSSRPTGYRPLRAASRPAADAISTPNRV